MKTKLLHVVNGLEGGGIPRGVMTLAENGFYDPFDFRLVELYRDKGPVHDKIIDIVGKDRSLAILEKDKKQLPHKAGLGRIYRQLQRSTEVPSLITGLYGAFKNLKPDVVILSDQMAQLVGRSAAAFFPDIKVVSFEHNTIKDSLPWKMPLWLTSIRNDAVFGDTAGTIQARSSAYLTPQASQVVPLVMFNTQTNRVIRSPDKFNILSLGRLEPEKNYPELVKAAVQLLREGYDVELTIAGEGQQRNDLETLIEKLHTEAPGLGILERIKLPGFLSNDALLRDYRQAADIYVQPSLREGFSIAVAEALAAGVPTVVTEFAGMKDYGNSNNMVVIDGYSSRGIADALRHVIINYNNVAPGLAQAGIETIKERFTEPPVRKEWQAAASLLMSGRRPSAPIAAVPNASAEHHYVS